MTYKEAIERLKWYFEEDDGGAAENITKMAYQIAIKALERLIAKDVERYPISDARIMFDSEKQRDKFKALLEKADKMR